MVLYHTLVPVLCWYLEVGDAVACHPQGLIISPQVSQGGRLAGEAVGGGGSLRTRFTAKPGLVVWQTAAMGGAVSGSNFSVGLMSNGYTMA